MNNATFFGASVVAISIQAMTTFIGGATVAIEKLTPPPIEGYATTQEKVWPGGTVWVKWKIVKRTDCPGVNSRVWRGENGFEITEESKPTELPVSIDWRAYDIVTEIPKLAPPGHLALTIEGEYRCPGADAVEFSLGPVLMEVQEM